MRQKGKWDGIVTEEMLERSCTMLREQLGGASKVEYEAAAEGVHPLCARENEPHSIPFSFHPPPALWWLVCQSPL